MYLVTKKVDSFVIGIKELSDFLVKMFGSVFEEVKFGMSFMIGDDLRKSREQ
jgi:hypothetical protein